MANRNFRNKYIFGMEKDVKQIFAKIAFGASGAPTVSTANSKGVASVTRTSAGLFVVKLGTPASSQALAIDKYKKLLFIKHVFIATGAPAAPIMQVVSEAIATLGTITIKFLAPDGVTATDPANGESVLLNMLFGDSNV